MLRFMDGMTGELEYLMKNSTKAVLLSALVFPGAGHFFLKKRIPGIILSGTAFAALYVVISNVVERALLIAQKIQSGDVQLDIAEITELVSRQPTGAEAQSLSIATTVLILLWVGGIADSYRVGHIQDKNTETGG